MRLQEIASTGLRDTTRLTSENVEMKHDILLSNSDNILKDNMITTTTTIVPEEQTTSYLIGRNLLRGLPALEPISRQAYDTFLFLSDETVMTHCGLTVLQALQQTGKPVLSSIVPSGEKSKRFETLQAALRPFFAGSISRRSVLIAVGGGMITDLGGFIGSILLRGIDTIYVPTTLLAQVDAAIGGKTGVDYWLDDQRMYKNMIGTIRQPTAVISDSATLKTLPTAEIQSGLGEMVKYWIGCGRPTIAALRKISEVETQGLASLQDLEEIISVCQKIKIGAAQQDPMETKGIRDQLNLGHTIGHGIESAANGSLSHGQAVAIGCAAAAKVSVAMGFLDQTTADHIEQTIQSLGLPTRAPGISAAAIQERMRLDKKGGTFVLIRNIGQLETRVTVASDIVEHVIESLVSHS